MTVGLSRSRYARGPVVVGFPMSEDMGHPTVRQEPHPPHAIEHYRVLTIRGYGFTILLVVALRVQTRGQIVAPREHFGDFV